MLKAELESDRLKHTANKARYNKYPVSCLLIDRHNRIKGCDDNFELLTNYSRDNIIDKDLSLILPVITSFNFQIPNKYSIFDLAEREQVKCSILNANHEFIPVMVEADALGDNSLRSVYLIDESSTNAINFQEPYPYQVSNIGQAIIGAGFDLVSCNKAYEEITGYSEDELKELPLEDLIQPEYVVTIKNYLELRFTNNTEDQPNIYTIGLKCKDGEKITVDLHIERLSGQKLLRSYIRRVHDMNQGGFKLSQITNQRDSYWNALNNSALISVTNCDGIIVMANDKFCEVSGYSKEELVGSNHHLLNSNYHPQSFWRGMWSTIKLGRAWRGEVRNKSKQGKFYWVDTTINPIMDSNGNVIQYLSVRYLITRRKEMEEEQKNLLKDLADYAFITSHELRGPMTRIQGLVNLFLNGHLSKVDDIESLGMLKSSLDELDAVTREMNKLLNRTSLGEN